jgi:hypothetical protein
MYWLALVPQRSAQAGFEQAKEDGREAVIREGLVDQLVSAVVTTYEEVA